MSCYGVSVSPQGFQRGCGASILELSSEGVLQLGRPVLPVFTVVVYAGVSLPRRKSGTLILLVYWSLAGLHSLSICFGRCCSSLDRARDMVSTGPLSSRARVCLSRPLFQGVPHKTLPTNPRSVPGTPKSSLLETAVLARGFFSAQVCLDGTPETLQP